MSKDKKDIRFFKIHPESGKDQVNLNIYNLLRREGNVLINELSQKVNISDDIASEYVKSCVEKNLLELTASDKGEIVRFKDDDSKVLGIGFYDKECILTSMVPAGRIAAEETIVLDRLIDLMAKEGTIDGAVDKILNETRLRDTKFSYAGMAIPNSVDPGSAGILAEGVKRGFGCDTIVAKEATAAGYGEKLYGEYSEKNSMLYIHLDVGTGAFIKGDVIFDADENAKEEGVAYLRPWDQYSVVSAAKTLVSKGVGTHIVDMVHGDIDSITLETVLRAAGNDDELAQDLIKRSGLALGVRAAYLINVFNPDVVVLGGGTEKKEGSFVKFVKEGASRFLLKDLADKLNIGSGTLGKKASSVGAAALCCRELFMEV